MPESLANKTVFSLSEIAEKIKQTLQYQYPSAFWIKAEMNKLNYYGKSGHCYPDLLEKRDGRLAAQIRALIWKEDYERINEQFLRVLKAPLKDGINILFSAKITFDTVYGLSLRILDIDPSWSLGELEREKMAAIARLRETGLFYRNKSLSLPLLPQRIAVISVETSKGYADFLTMLRDNPWGYRFFHWLFPSLLQGDKVAESIMTQLNLIARVKDHFDLVAIIRGGGGDVGLSGYNHFELAKSIACFPLPVMTGIGHATNETVAEMVAYKNGITPTELAGFLIQKFHDFSVPVNEARKTITGTALRLLNKEKQATGLLSSDLIKFTSALLQEQQFEVVSMAGRIKSHSGFYLKNGRENVARTVSGLQKEIRNLVFNDSTEITRTFSRLQHAVQEILGWCEKSVSLAEKQVSLLDPGNVLARGYSITLKNGKVLRNCDKLLPGDLLTTLLQEGAVESRVTTLQPELKNKQDHE